MNAILVGATSTRVVAENARDWQSRVFQGNTAKSHSNDVAGEISVAGNTDHETIVRGVVKNIRCDSCH